jgi:adenylosuccinate lyase
MRRYAIEQPYEKLKAFTRGKAITKEMMIEFVDSLELPQAEKDALKAMTPSSYVGNAAEQAKAL